MGSASGLNVGLGAFVVANFPAGSANLGDFGSASGLNVGLDATVLPAEGSAVGAVLVAAGLIVLTIGCANCFNTLVAGLRPAICPIPKAKVVAKVSVTPLFAI